MLTNEEIFHEGMELELVYNIPMRNLGYRKVIEVTPDKIKLIDNSRVVSVIDLTLANLLECFDSRISIYTADGTKLLCEYKILSDAGDFQCK